MISEWDRQTALTDLGDGAFGADLADGWRVGGGINGGYLLATIGSALSRVTEKRDPLSVSAYYVGASAPGPAEIRTRVVRDGGSVATLAAAAILASVTSSLVQTTARVVGGAASATAAAAGSANVVGDPGAYFTDMLLRPLPGSHPETTAVATAAPNLVAPTETASPELRSEVGRILAYGLAQPEFPQTDESYLSQVVAARTGLSADAAKSRVDNVIAGFRDAKAKVEEIANAGPAFVEVALRLGGQRLRARITRKSADEMAIARGRQVVALLKAVSVERRVARRRRPPQ